MSCIRCRSQAINSHLHGRDGSDTDLCDVCYWRKRFEAREEELCRLGRELLVCRNNNLWLVNENLKYKKHAQQSFSE